jgi:hypothetical protein
VRFLGASSGRRMPQDLGNGRFGTGAFRHLRRLPAPTARMDVAGVPADLNRLVDEIAEQELRLILESDGAPIAAVIPLADLRRLLRLDERDREARATVEAMREAFRDVPDEEIVQQTERIMADMRNEPITGIRPSRLTAADDHYPTSRNPESDGRIHSRTSSSDRFTNVANADSE